MEIEIERYVHSNRENGQREKVGEPVEILLHPWLTGAVPMQPLDQRCYLKGEKMTLVDCL